MKALVVGFGSIGQRHTGILEALGHEVAVVSRRSVDASPLFCDLDQALAEYRPDYVVIASRTSEHGNDVSHLASLGFGGRVIVEKPLYKEPRPPPTHGFSSLHVAYNLRFHPAVRRFRALLNDREVASVHAYVGQYLPDWRPTVDYRETHSASKAGGGGALRELSHELDYLTWALGGWKHLSALGGRFSGLQIDSDDVFSLLIEMERSPLVSLTLNYLDTVLRREVIAHTDAGTIRMDLVAGTVEHGDRIEKFVVDRNDTYIAEHRAALDGDSDVICTVEEGADIVYMIAAAERAASERIWVSRTDAGAC